MRDHVDSDESQAAPNRASHSGPAGLTTLTRAVSRSRGFLRLPGIRRREVRGQRLKVGARPGIESCADLQTPPAEGQVKIHYVDYGPSRVVAQDVDHLDEFLAQPRPDWSAVRWININGLHPHVIDRFRQVFGFHTLAAEDTLNVPQRPKIESYPDHLFLVTRMLRRIDGQLKAEQVSVFFYRDTLITFQEVPGDVWQPIRERIQNQGSRLRQNGTDYLLYALLDAVVDHSFPILEYYGDTLEDLDRRVAESPDTTLLREVHGIKRELVMLRRVMWPMRELVDQLDRDDSDALSLHTKTYLQDVYDHTIQVIEIIETYREMSNSLTDLYMSAVSNRMNEVMKMLTVMASFFIPITFLAGVYGMNFEHIPELRWPYAYWVFWGFCLAMVLSLYLFFRRKGWIGKR